MIEMKMLLFDYLSIWIVTLFCNEQHKIIFLKDYLRNVILYSLYDAILSIDAINKFL